MAQLSIKNLTLLLICLILFLSSLAAKGAVLIKDKMWPQGTSLNVVFIDGTPKLKTLVKRYAPLWLQNSNLSFVFFEQLEKAPKESHIRISFNGYTGSILGNHGELLSKQPTMLLAELTSSDLPEDYAKRFILHEFGHALGFAHEYRNPGWPFGLQAIKALQESCYPRLQAKGLSLTHAKAQCADINEPLNNKLVETTIYDEYSIMNYPQRIQLKDKSFKSIIARYKLSVLDKLAIQRWYPIH